MLWLYLHCPYLYIEYSFPSEEHGKPLGIRETANPKLRLCNPQAIRHGIHPSMSLTTAYCLCPDLKVRHYSDEIARKAHNYMAATLQEYSAWISPDEDFGFYLEIGSLRRIWTNPLQLQGAIHQHIRTLGHHAFSAMAPTPGAARLLARNRLGNVLDSGEALSLALDPLAVDVLERAEKTTLRLYKSGLKTLGALRKAAAEDLAYRVDPELPQTLKRIYGQETWYPVAMQPAPFFQTSFELVEELDSLLPLQLPMSHALRKFCDYLQSHQLTASRSCFELFQRNKTGDQPEQLALTLASPDNQPESWIFRLKNSLESAQISQPVYGFRLYCHDLFPVHQETISLFQSPGTDSHREKNLLNRLSSRLGLNNVYYLSHRESLLPEQQSHPTRNREQKTEKIPVFSNPPIWLLTPPKRARITDYRIIRGPYRLSAAWWEPLPVHRDYYVALQWQTGALHWIYQDRQQMWYCHGLFA